MTEESIEELKAKQAAYSEEQKPERQRQAEEDRGAEDERMGREAASERQDLLNELRAEQEKARQMEEEGIVQRIEDAQKIKESRDEAQRHLKETTLELQAIRERLDGIQQIVDEARQSGYAVDPDVEAAFNDAQGKYGEINQRFEDLSGKVEELEARLISDELIQQYQDTIRRIKELSRQIFEIESNPAVIGLLEREAKSEDELRSVVSETLLDAPEYRVVSQAERAEYLRQLAQIYIGEAFAYKGIRDPGGSDREAAEKLIQDMVRGLRDHNGFEKLLYGDSVKPDERDGFVLGMTLGKLAGKADFGTPSSVGSNLEYLMSGGSKGSVEAKAQGVRAFLRSLNFARAYREGLAFFSYQEDITPIGGMALSGERDKILSMGFEGSYDEGPIVPRSASEDEKRKIKEEYEKHKSFANQRARERVASELESARARILVIETEIANLEQQYHQSRQVEASLPKLVRSLRLDSHYYQGLTPLNAARMALESLESGIERVEREIAELQSEKIRFLDLSRKRERSQLINKKETERDGYYLERDSIQNALPTLELAEKSAEWGGSHSISARILQKKDELTRAKEILQMAERAVKIISSI